MCACVWYSENVVTYFLTALKDLPSVYFVHVYYRQNLVSDPDDNKFVDCYVAAAAQNLVQDDSHFNMLKGLPFPEVNVVKIQEFESILK